MSAKYLPSVDPWEREKRGACSTDYTTEEAEFLTAMQKFMKENRRRFPTFIEVLEVAKSLGYRKVDTPQCMVPDDQLPVEVEGSRID